MTCRHKFRARPKELTPYIDRSQTNNTDLYNLGKFFLTAACNKIRIQRNV